MSLSNMPEIYQVKNGKLWQHEYSTFSARIYVPDNTLPGQIVNMGFKAPCLIVFEENRATDDELISYAEESGLSALAAEYDSSVIFVYPTSANGWDDAAPTLYQDLISEIRIGPFYEDGVLIQKDFFHHGPDQYYIRGAIFRVCLFGCGRSADYIAENCVKTIHGEYLWGPGEITPSAVCLQKLNIVPKPERNDIAVISLSNTNEINQVLREKCKYLIQRDVCSFQSDWHCFTVRFKRWCGKIEEEPDFSVNGMTEEYGVETVTTSPDDLGRYKGTVSHPVGYYAYYENGVLKEGKCPVVFAFHGGGDSALHICHVSGWWRLAQKYHFLLIAVENHLDVTATQVMELIDKLKKKYPIDESRMYATGFSMGGCKTWDLFQEYPAPFAALAPMDATFDHGCNSFGVPAPRMNHDVPVPIFYAGGEETPLPELPFQAQKCVDRIKYVFEVDRIKKPYHVHYSEKELWENKIWGVSGDRIEKIYDASRTATLTLHLYQDDKGEETVALASISPQGHECRIHTCEQAWLFMSKFHK